ncbi:MFS transporter [Actinokineospora pegani]|uniref:MFS transporter n=1 Tax=Actinokineospora pegani TaxID=2654637 RepID=UPI0012EAF6A2|nr:MFS transporter [Actinokineospora pegani]
MTAVRGEQVRERTDWPRMGTLVSGQAVSLIGDSMLSIALSWSAVRLGGAGAVTLLMLCSTLPKAVMLLVGGAVADALGPRFTLLRTTSGRVVLLALGAVGVLVAESLPVLAVIAVVEGVLLGLGGPSFGTILPRLASGDDLLRANSGYSTVTRLAPILGAPLGAALIAVGHLWMAMAVVSLTCAVALACLAHVTRGMRARPDPARTPLLRRSLDGFRVLGRSTRLRRLFVSSFLIDFCFGWPLLAAVPLLAVERGWGVGAVGSVIAAFSGGALASTALGAAVAHRLPLFARLVVSGFVLAAALLAMAFAPDPVVLSAIAFGAGAASGFNGPATVTLFQAAAPPGQMGSAMAALALAGIGTAPFSAAVFGGLALLVGVQATWVTCGVIAFAGPVVGILALRTR